MVYTKRENDIVFERFLEQFLLKARSLGKRSEKEKKILRVVSIVLLEILLESSSRKNFTNLVRNYLGKVLAYKTFAV